MKGITKRQQQVLDFISACIRKEGRPPTRVEIADHFGWESHNAAAQHLRLLAQKGYLELDQGGARGIRIPKDDTEVELRKVSLLGRIPAGSPIEAIEDAEAVLGVDAAFFPAGDLFALRVKGDSMRDAGILDKDVALIRKQATADHGRIVAAMIAGEATLKRFLRKGKNIILHPENSDYEDIAVGTGEELQILGVLAGVMRRA